MTFVFISTNKGLMKIKNQTIEGRNYFIVWDEFFDEPYAICKTLDEAGEFIRLHATLREQEFHQVPSRKEEES